MQHDSCDPRVRQAAAKLSRHIPQATNYSDICFNSGYAAMRAAALSVMQRWSNTCEQRWSTLIQAYQYHSHKPESLPSQVDWDCLGTNCLLKFLCASQLVSHDLFGRSCCACATLRPMWLVLLLVTKRDCSVQFFRHSGRIPAWWFDSLLSWYCWANLSLLPATRTSVAGLLSQHTGGKQIEDDPKTKPSR